MQRISNSGTRYNEIPINKHCEENCICLNEPLLRSKRQISSNSARDVKKRNEHQYVHTKSYEIHVSECKFCRILSSSSITYT